MRDTLRFFILMSCCLLLWATVVSAEGNKPGTAYTNRWFAQTVFVPTYSQVFYGDTFKRGTKKFKVATTLNIRNTDSAYGLTILEARYVSHKGELLKDFIAKETTLGPLESIEFFIDEGFVEGGMGTSFLVRWESDVAVTSPVVGAVIIGTQSSQGISFVENGHILEGRRP